MKKLLVAAVVLCALGAELADARPPCCETDPSTGKRCHRIQDPPFGPPGCTGSDENCVGGGVVPSGDMMSQSILAGCICLGGTCVSDGSVGDWANGDPAHPTPEATLQECARDAALGCDQGVVPASE